ncbi:unnamed protein product [Polarella glacialis]|uniref:Uncharacterized protein n=1 Tax=Polarella glacialis TaxID=89957 RepID=A0A813J7D2_POLGL|nr:unnamed protein product [Polarella glacialis]
MQAAIIQTCTLFDLAVWLAMVGAPVLRPASSCARGTNSSQRFSTYHPTALVGVLWFAWVRQWASSGCGWEASFESRLNFALAFRNSQSEHLQHVVPFSR